MTNAGIAVAVVDACHDDVFADENYDLAAEIDGENEMDDFGYSFEHFVGLNYLKIELSEK